MSIAAEASRKHNFLVLDGLRGVAAITVLIAHATSLILGHAIFERKYMAVQFFFMLSGFVVMCAYERRLKSGMTFGQFCLRRAIRLYPLIIIGTLMGWVYFSMFDPAFAADPRRLLAVARSALALPSYDAGFGFSKFPMNPPEWSLFFELLAYGVFGLVARRATMRALIVCAGAGLVLYAITTVRYQHDLMPFKFHALGIWASFAIGMLLWRAYQAQLLQLVAVPFPLLAAVMLLICAIPAGVSGGVNVALVAVVFPAVILFGANCAAPALRQALEFLGELSYPLYILHWPIMLFTQRAVGNTLGPVATVFAACALSLAGSWVIYAALDRPLRNYLNVKFCSQPSLSSMPGAQPG